MSKLLLLTVIFLATTFFCTALPFSKQEYYIKLISSADSLFKNDHYSEAIKIYIEVLISTKNVESKEFLSELYYKISNGYYYLNNLDESLNYNKNGIELLDTTVNENKIIASKLYYQRGEVLGYLNFPYEAINNLLNYLSLSGFKYDQHNLNTGYFNAFGRLAGHYRSIGSIEKASEFSNLMMEMVQKGLIKNKSKIAQAYMITATNMRAIADYNSALEYINKSIEILKSDEENKDFNSISDALLVRGAVYDSKGDYQKAIDDINESLKIEIQVDSSNNPDLSFHYYDIGTAYQNLKKFDDALKYFKKSLKLDEKMYGTEHYFIAWNYLALAGTYSQKGIYDSALYYYNLCFPVFEKELHNKHYLFTEFYQSRSDYYFYNGDKNNALSDMQEALQTISFNYSSTNYATNPFVKNIIISEYALVVISQKADLLYYFWDK